MKKLCVRLADSLDLRHLVFLALASTFVLGSVPGCGRVLTITQDSFVNNAMQQGRPDQSKWTGEPLEVTIVCIHPKDLNKYDLNSRLAPGSGITCDVWYENRPILGDKVDDEGQSRFRLPAGQVFVATDDTTVYGKRPRGPLRGARIEGKKVTFEFDFGGSLFDKKSAIYVFPKFMGPDGSVLPVRPVVFRPPGAYTHKLFVKIGVGENREHYGQYIENLTERKLHGKEADR
ncbi:MAG: hypothetical protein IIB60_00225 [Planctomycetes bacterium]|nr:hypothetical protein [Planctomycetota bacterium]